MTVRAARVDLKPPDRVGRKLPPVTVNAVWIREESPPAGVKPIEWLLLTSLPVDTFATACRVVEFYTSRWPIEVFFRIYKSGCRIEEIQLESEDRLLPCLAPCTSLRRSHHSRKQNQPALRRLRSGRYLYQSRRELPWSDPGHPSSPRAPRGQVGRRGLAVLAVRARRRVRLGLGCRPPPADPAVRPVRAVPKGQLDPAPRQGPEDRRVLAGLVCPGDRPDQPDPQGQLRQQDREDLAVLAQGCTPPA